VPTILSNKEISFKFFKIKKFLSKVEPYLPKASIFLQSAKKGPHERVPLLFSGLSEIFFPHI